MTDGITINPLTYMVDEICPVEDGLWKAKIEFDLPENHGEVRVAHNVSVIVRFKYPADGSAEGLVQMAHEKAIAVLGAASRATGKQSAAELLARSWSAARYPDEDVD